MKDVPETRLYFLPYEFEGGFIKDTQGKMYGLTSCFVAGLASAIVSGSQDNEELYESIGKVYVKELFQLKNILLKVLEKMLKNIHFLILQYLLKRKMILYIRIMYKMY